MAMYNNGFPMNYQQMYYPQQTQPSQPQTSIIWVQGEAAAKSYPVAPNTSIPLWDSEANVIYVKSADASGMPSMRVIEYTFRDSPTRSPEISSQTGFATKDDISHLEEEINALRSKFERMGNKKEQKNG